MFTIAKKELKSYFDHPTAYIFLAVFLVVNSFFFFRIAYVQGIASLRAMFDILPWLLLLFVPAITMRLIAEEFGSGTYELLRVQPVRLWQILIGKLLGALFFITVVFLLTLSVVFSLMGVGSFDWGVVVGQYVASLFLSFSLVTVGIFASSLSRSQVVSFIIALAISFFFIISGSEVVVVELTGFIREFFSTLSLLGHYQNMTRGVIDLRDVVYFLSFGGIFLIGTYVVLVRRSAHRRGFLFRQLQLGSALLVIVLILTNVAVIQFSARLDLSRGKLYTLSPATQEFLRGLDDIVTIKVFASENLPPQISFLMRDVRDMLTDFERESDGLIRIEYITVDSDGPMDEVGSYGITPVQFNILKQQEFTVQQGYFGVAVVYLDSFERISFVQTTDDFEYQIASFIRKLTTKDSQHVAFVAGHGEKSQFRDLVTFREELSKQYDITELDLTQQRELLDTTDVLVVAGPTQEYSSSEVALLKEYIDRGGSAFFLIDAVSVNPRFLEVSTSTEDFSDVLQSYGVSVRQDIAYDIRSNASVSFGGGPISYILPYPFWMRVPAVDDNPISGDVQDISLPWASTVGIDRDELASRNIDLFEVLKSTQFAGVQTDQFNVTPDQRFSAVQDDLGERVMAVALTVPLTQSVPEDSLTSGRVVVVGDSDFITDQFFQTQGSSANVVFALNAVDWLAQDESLIGIRSKNRQPAPLVFPDDRSPNTIRNSNLFGVPIAVVVVGSIYLWYRRRVATLKRYKA